jgi:hypothetical protein
MKQSVSVWPPVSGYLEAMIGIQKNLSTVVPYLLLVSRIIEVFKRSVARFLLYPCLECVDDLCGV